MASQDECIRGILAVTLNPAHADASARPPVLYLDALAQELAEEQGVQPPVLMSRDALDRLIVSRLIEAPPDSYPQQPFHYLLGCFARCSAALRSLTPRQDAATQQELTGTIGACRDLLVSYAGLILSGSGVVPEPDASAQRGPLQLLDALDARDSGSGGGPPPPAGAEPLPHGFLEELALQQEPDTLGQMLAPIVRELAGRVSVCSPLGAYSAPMAALKQLVSIEGIAKALVALPSFLPDLAANTGRAIMLPGMSWLGPAFVVSVLPDQGVRAQPSVIEQCFAGVSTGARRMAEADANTHTLRLAGRHVVGELQGIVKALLGKATREAMLAWLGGVINGNRERAKMQANIAVAASNGFFCNLCAVLLKLCGPFLDANSGLAFKRVDPRYVPLGRLNFKEDTKLAATQQEEAAWLAAQAAAGTALPPDGGFHFICESFFMTARALHLGLVKLASTVVDEQSWAARELAEAQQMAEEQVARSAGTPAEALAQAHEARVRGAVDNFQASQLCCQVVLGDQDLVEEALAFYKLVARWLLMLVSPSGMPQLPLPEQVPPSFALLPEWLVEDLAELLLYVTRMQPQLLAGQRLDELMLFMVVFMGSPAYIRNPYLRSKLSEVVHAWLPRDTPGTSFVSRRASALDASLAPLFSADPLVLGHLVPALLQLYTDVEHTDRANQFYQKFTMRQYIGDILMYAWRQPEHRQAWAAYAALDGGRGPYLRFANMLINDSTWLLDEAMKKLQELRQLEGRLAAPAGLSPQELAEAGGAARQAGGAIRSLFTLASGAIATLATSSSEVTGPFLLPEMVERLAAMLNYFLLYLTGPQRKVLKVKDPEAYNFKPKELLASICTIYLHMAAADRAGVFAAAIAADGRSYRPEMFAEASLVLRQFGLLGEGQVQLLERLAGQVAQAAAAGQAEDEVMGEVPEEFLDPIQYTLMRDPVTLPTSGAVMDRATIMRHLLSDQRDPINRQPLTPDMLTPAAELKGRIDAWLAQQRRSSGQQQQQNQEQEGEAL